jgi:hypothetical protein
LQKFIFIFFSLTLHTCLRKFQIKDFGRVSKADLSELRKTIRKHHGQFVFVEPENYPFWLSKIEEKVGPQRRWELKNIIFGYSSSTAHRRFSNFRDARNPIPLCPGVAKDCEKEKKKTN